MKRLWALGLCLMLWPGAMAEVYVADVYGLSEADGYSLLIGADGDVRVPPWTYRELYRITPESLPDDAQRFGAAPCALGIEYDPEKAEALLYSTDAARVALMDGQGRLLTGYDYLWLDWADGYVVYTLPGGDYLKGALDAAGHEVVPPEYAALRHLGGGRWLALMRRGDGAEAVVLEPDGSVRALGLHTANEYLIEGSDGTTVVQEVEEYDGRSVYVDADGAVMFDTGFEAAEGFDGAYAVADPGGGYGVIDRDGYFAVPPVFSYITCDDGMPCVAVAGSRVAVYAGEDLSPVLDMDFAPEEVSANPLSPWLVLVRAGERRLVFNAAGDLVMEAPEGSYVMPYDHPTGEVDRLAVDNGAWPDDVAQVVDLDGRALGETFKGIGYARWRDGQGRYVVNDYRLYTDRDGERLVDWNSYRYGLADEEGRVLLPLVYDRLEPLGFDRYWAVRGEQFGMIDGTGKWYYVASAYDTLMD